MKNVTGESYSQLSYHERDYIYRGLCTGKTQGQIGKELGRHKSTISREVRRNSDQIGYLYAGAAHKMAQNRRNKNKPKIEKNGDLKTYVLEKLNERWSPKAIAGRWKLEHNDSKISAESIYDWIYSANAEELGLKKLLVRAHKKRGMKRRQAKAPKIKDRISIHARPDQINQRLEFGHYEGDLMFNSGSQSENILTLIERVTRHAVLIKNESKHTETVIDALIHHIVQTKLVVKSITFDNGSEFADHVKLNKMGIRTYFCDPHSPWQKGSAENLNGVVRRFFPFEKKAQSITREIVESICRNLNDMPREILSFRTPLEAFNRVSCGGTL